MPVGVKKTVTKRQAATKPKSSVSAAAKRASVKVQNKAPIAPKSVHGIKAVAINLVKREDRWKKLQKSISRHAPWLEVARLDAVDGRSNPPPQKDVCSRYSTARLSQLFHWYKPMSVKMSPGERGCCASHLKAWRLAAKGTKPLLVLEDDAVVLHTFTASVSKAVAEAPKGTGMIWLSSKDRGYPKPFGEVLMSPYFVWTTVGYLIWPATARMLLEMMPMDMPVDNFLAWHIKEGRIKAYSMRPAAVRQAQTWNVGSDIKHSDDVAHR